METKNTLNRRTELDFLRLAAFLGVVGLHVGSSVWKDLALWTSSWLGATLLRVTWPVPMFVMLSGRFLLDPERTSRLGQYIARLAVAFVFWGIVYQLYYLAVDWGAFDWKRFAAGVFTGAYHMWYLWMLLGLYLLTPLLRKIAEDRGLTRYFLMLHIFWQCFSYLLTAVPKVGNTLSQALLHLDLSLVGGFSGYCLLGYALSRWQPTAREKYSLYGLGLACWAISVLGNLIITQRTGVNSEFFTSYPSPLLIPQAAAVFVLFEKDLTIPGQMEKLAGFAGKYGFGAYLCHALVNEWTVRQVGKEALSAHPLLLIPVLTLVVAAVSFALSWLLQKLPKIGHYIA